MEYRSKCFYERVQLYAVISTRVFRVLYGCFERTLLFKLSIKILQHIVNRHYTILHLRIAYFSLCLLLHALPSPIIFRKSCRKDNAYNEINPFYCGCGTFVLILQHFPNKKS